MRKDIFPIGPSRIRPLYILLILLPLLFIFIQSMLPPRLSEKESSWLLTLLLEIFGKEGFFYKVIRPHFRKLAHFFEYAVLGGVVGGIFHPKRFSKKVLPHSVSFGFFVAVLDETIQIFSKRGSSLRDVWLDFFGYFTGFLLTTLVILLIKRRKKE